MCPLSLLAFGIVMWRVHTADVVKKDERKTIYLMKKNKKKSWLFKSKKDDKEIPTVNNLYYVDIHDHNTKMQVTNTDMFYAEGAQSSPVIGPQNSFSLVDSKGGNKVASVNLNCVSKTSKETKKVQPGKGADPNLPICKKKKLLRIEKKLAKNPNTVIKTSVPEQKSLEELIAENDSVSTDEVKKLRVSLVKTGTEEFAKTFNAGASLFAKYQIAVHNDQPEECDVENYLEFLVDSPLKAKKSDHCDHPGYGSFHQQYWLGDKLIAVGVVDILPKCVSSVYLFYDPDYHHMVLGYYSAIREICLVRQLCIMSPDLKYYYMGFYLHSCSKMRYKSKFRPSFLLCPVRYTWHAIDKCIQKLDKEKYSIFNEESEDILDDNDTLIIENVPVLYNNSGKLMTYSAYKRRKKNIDHQDKILAEYTMLVGSKLATQLVYCL